MSEKPWPYEDIVNQPHHVSKKHPPMEMIKRAAQFAPFAALTGYGDAVEETARLTNDKAVLAEDTLAEMDRKVSDALILGNEVTITYFIPDERKDGGRYDTAKGKIIKAEMGMICLDDGTKINADSISEIQ